MSPFCGFGGCRLRVFCALSLWLIMAVSAQIAVGAPTPYDINSQRLQAIADKVLTLTGYSLTPDVNTGSLSFNDQAIDNPELSMVSMGGGFTLENNAYPIYLEGTLGRTRYDPVFLIENKQTLYSVETLWTTLSATGGVGWDFSLPHHFTLRPVLNISAGQLLTDGSIRNAILEGEAGDEMAFLLDGERKSRGLGGTLMLDYAHYRPEREIDAELRYSAIHLRSAASKLHGVSGSADADTLSLWLRLRQPMGVHYLQRPLRYVLEGAYTEYLGDLRGTLGFNALQSVGAGLEIDSSAKDIYVSRTRLMLRYRLGARVQGPSLGVAMSF